jgi:hypothetical protein
MADIITAPITINETTITPLITINENTITTPLTVGFQGPAGLDGDTGAPGLDGVGAPVPVVFNQTNLVQNGSVYELTVAHGKSVAYIPLHNIMNNLGQIALVPATYIDADSFKLSFPAAIPGDWTLTYI